MALFQFLGFVCFLFDAMNFSLLTKQSAGVLDLVAALSGTMLHVLSFVTRAY